MFLMAIDSFPPEPHTPSDEAAWLSQVLEATQADAAVQRMEFAQAASAWERTSAALTSEIAEKQQIIASYEMQIKALKQELDAIYASSSWRITAPLRSVVTFLKNLRLKNFTSGKWLPISKSRLQATDEGSLPARHHAPEIRSPQLSILRTEVGPHGTAPAMAKLVVIDQLNTSDEPESVQRLYRQFTRARKQALENS
jgi:hypothetical protein